MRLDTQHKLDKLFITATKLHDQIANTQSQIDAKEQEIKKALRTALIGGTRAGTGAKPAADTQAFSNAYTTSCAGNAGPGKSLANDLVCLCAATTGTDPTTLKMCTSVTATGGYTTDVASAANAVTVYNILQPICASTAATEDATPEAITAAIASFTGVLGRNTGLTTATDKGAYVFGKGQDSGNECNGGAGSQQSCVNYHAVITTGQPKPLTTAIAWLGQLAVARTALNARRKLTQQKEKEPARLISLADKMQELYQEALHGDFPITTQTQSKPQAAPDSDKPKACEKYHNKSKECKENGCQRKGTSDTKGACETKPGSETPAAGTGKKTKEEVATTGCVAHKDKTNCENDKTGDKQNCAWRKGKDGKDDKETEKCRDGSFLVKKKLALIVSAFIVLRF
uniref:Variant surface glycoprotein 1125.3095 n=1 Tax=Trypanosoma brucei TaxID=5691 RepID=A0A1J0R9F7_9TRYP|nr:variant surface glycoprotein 1125.3095 [Trypanosoma brucei]